MSEATEVLAQQLAELGLWDGLEPEVQVSERARVAAGGYPLVTDVLLGKCHFLVDGETLAEGGIERFLSDEVAPALARYGIEFRVERIRGFDLLDKLLGPVPWPPYPPMFINGNLVFFMGHEDDDADTWYLATVRPLAYVNDLLAEAGVRARFLTMNTGGNEGMAYLFDPRIADAMRDSGLFQPDSIPVLVVDDRARTDPSAN